MLDNLSTHEPRNNRRLALHEVKELNAVVTMLVHGGHRVWRYLERGRQYRDAIALAAVTAADQRAAIGHLGIAPRPSWRSDRRLRIDIVDNGAFPRRLVRSDHTSRVDDEFTGGAFAPRRDDREHLRGCRLPGSDPTSCSSLYQRRRAYPLAGLLADVAAAFTVNTLVAKYGPRSTDRRCVMPCA